MASRIPGIIANVSSILTKGRGAPETKRDDANNDGENDKEGTNPRTDEEGKPSDAEDTEVSPFSEKAVRRGFIRKVYGILMCQLALTIALMCLVIFVEPIKVFAYSNSWVLISFMIGSFILMIVLACCPNVRRSYPLNIILLAFFTVLQGFMLGFISSLYNTELVLIAVGVTAVIAFSLTIFAFQTKIDFTMMGGLLFVFLIVLVMFGLLCAIIQNEYAKLAYSCVGALLFSAYLVFDTQMMMGGKHKYSLSPEEYIFAALNLYLDIIQLFIHLMSILIKIL